jgi:hypothetical protein
LDGGGSVGEEGVEDAFELLHEINERVRTGLWVGDCFIYNNSSWRLNYCVGGEVSVFHHIKGHSFQLDHLLLELYHVITISCVTGHNLVSLGSAYVFIRISCKPKPCLSYR